MPAKPQPRARTIAALLIGLFALSGLGQTAWAVEVDKAKKPESKVKITKVQPKAAKVKIPTQDRMVAGSTKVQGKLDPGTTGRASQILFFILAALCVCFSLVTITRKSPLMAAMSLLVVFICLAGVYLFLAAPFMAVIQIIVYAGAVIVLFVFVIMSIGLNEERSIKDLGTEILYFVCAFLFTGAGAAMYHFGQTWFMQYALFGLFELMAFGILVWYLRFPLTRFLGAAAVTFALLQVVKLVTMAPVLIGKAGLVRGADVHTVAASPGAGFGDAKVIGHSIFGENVFAFEALSLLLLAAIVAAVVVVRSRKEQSS